MLLKRQTRTNLKDAFNWPNSLLCSSRKAPLNHAELVVIACKFDCLTSYFFTDIFSASLLVVAQIQQTKAECTNQTHCRNLYNTTSRGFYRTHWNLSVVPDDIPGEAREVFLHHNRITHLPLGVFSHLTECYILHLENNEISQVHQGALDFLNNLHTLNLVRNKMSYIGPVWRGLNNLKWLYIQWNQISQIEDRAFHSLHLLERLVLDQNYIRRIGLRTFEGLGNLVQLFLYHNQISAIEDGAFANLGKLEVLYLHENRISRVEKGMWRGLDSLRDLHLFQNHISHIQESAFDSVSNLHELYLGHNTISDINWVSRNLQNLRLIDLESNQISNIQHETFNHHSLSNIFLHNNYFTSLDPDFFINLPRPLNLTFSGTRGTNRWTCRTLCWVKHEEHHGTLKLSHNGQNYQPKCADGTEWESLPCGSSG